MCGRYTLAVKVDLIPIQFDLPGVVPDPEDPAMALPRYNVAPTQSAVIVRVDRGARVATWARWGFLPRGAKDIRQGARMINARAETVFTQSAFRGAARHQRCLVPTDGFIEWRTIDKRKQPYHFRAADDGLYAMAGIWSTWSAPDGAPVETFAVLTTEPNPLVAELHDRMPVILTPDRYEQWLDPSRQDPDELAPLLVAAPEASLRRVPVRAAVNSVKNDGPECVERISEEEAQRTAPQLGFGF